MEEKETQTMDHQNYQSPTQGTSFIRSRKLQRNTRTVTTTEA